MKLTEMKGVLPDRKRQTYSSSCFDAEANFGLHLLAAYSKKLRPPLLTRPFTLVDESNVELPVIQKSDEFGARNYLVCKGKYTGFIGCSWSGELRRPLMLWPKGTSYHIYLLQEQAEELFQNQPKLYEDDGWYPKLMTTVLLSIVDGFDLTNFVENTNSYYEYHSSK